MDQTLHDLPNVAGNFGHRFPPPAVSLSPTATADHNYNNSNDNLLPFKRNILSVEPISSKQPEHPFSMLKSARLLMLKKSKSMAVRETGFLDENINKKQESKLFTVKFKLKEAVDVPVFAGENSLRKHISDDSLSDESSKIFSKEMIRKYLKLVKPFYFKVSRKQAVKPGFSGELLSAASPSTSPATLPSYSAKKRKQGTIPAGIQVVCKHLGKSKPASSAAVVPPATVSRRDDSLFQQYDGIQSAILHCKRSFNSSSFGDSSLQLRFASDPLHEYSISSPRISHEEAKITI